MLQQRGVEDALLGVGMRVQPVTERLPDRRQLVVGFGVVEAEELPPEPVVIGIDEIDDVGHGA